MADLGVITIGQAPRTDLTPELVQWLPGVRLHERGALDGLTHAQIARMSPREGEEVLTTRLADGSSVVIGHDHVLPRMQQAVTELEERGVDAVLLACTGTFPHFEHRKPLLVPELMIGPGVAALAGRAATVGILVPLPEQRQHPDGKYAALAARTVVADATPYSAQDEGLLAAADDLRAQGAELIVADCIGYSQRMRRLVSRRAGVPVVLARSIVARLTAELLDDGTAA
ncbi:AroM family protein [Kineococcus sp. SYSU DK003]|uniref:AroM family protein n=1 Tax=Kineococcus sp. SYSU DK003 TaxID=3383124 RepID=UPI003D7D86CB